MESGFGVALAHRRLAVVDLSSCGHQPMLSPSERFVITYNGEVYNHRALRRELSDEFRFRGHSDTEVALAAIERWGLREALKRFVGMFAFVLWDRHSKEMHLVCDRFGKKPLYYGWSGGSFLFGSELKALAKHPHFQGDIDREALSLYFRLGYIPAPRSIYQSFKKVEPGCVVSLPHPHDEGNESFERFWTMDEIVRLPRPSLNVDAARAQLRSHLDEAVAQRMEADVPVGAFLSGGVDSSLVVALMQSQTNRRIKTFTVGFADPSYDEAADAKRVADHLGTEHAEVRVSNDDVKDLLRRIPDIYDEPFSDSSQIPACLVSQVAAEEVTVALSGDGGDEAFGGYNRHVWAHRLRMLGKLPEPVVNVTRRVVYAKAPQEWDDLFRKVARAVPAFAQKRAGEKMYKIADVLGSRNPAEAYDRLVSNWSTMSNVVLDGYRCDSLVRTHGATQLEDPSELMMYLDTISYLPGDILTKVDRASMAVGLEVRCPLLDHRLVEFAWSLPPSMKVSRKSGKRILRDLLAEMVPPRLFDRPKTGFAIPLHTWLRGSLRDWAEQLLDPTVVAAQGYLNAQEITRVWKEHLSGRRDHKDSLWSVLMFQAWLGREER